MREDAVGMEVRDRVMEVRARVMEVRDRVMEVKSWCGWE